MAFLPRGPFLRGWMPDADAANAPPDALLRADNLTLDQLGVLTLRRDVSRLSTLADADVHSLHTAVLNAVRYRLVGADFHVYANGNVIASVGGSGDVVFGSHLGQILFARGASRFKYDGTTVRPWGITPPAHAPIVTPGLPDGKTFAVGSQALAEFTVAEGTGPTYQSNHAGVANGAAVLTTDATTSRGTFARNFLTVTDFTRYDAGTDGDPSDVISFYVYITDPTLVSEIDFLIDVNDTTFQTDYYLATFSTQQVADVGQPLTADVPNANAPDPVSPPPASAPGVGPVSVLLNVGWNQVKAARSQFVRTGLTNGKDWTTVSAIRFTVRAYAATPVAFDTVRIAGGRVTGEYNWCYCLAYNSGTYVGVSGPSPFSAPLTLTSQGAVITIPADATRDTQANEVWVFRIGGNLPDPYQVAVETDINDAAVHAYFTVNQPWEEAHLVAIGATDNGPANFTQPWESTLLGPPGTIVGPGWYNFLWEADSGHVVAAGLTVYRDPLGQFDVDDTLSDVDALVRNIVLEVDNARPPANIIGIEGPFYDRTFVLTSDGFLYPSRQLNPDSFAVGQSIRVAGAEETAYWVKKAVGGLYVGTSKDVYRLEGDGTELPDGSINFTKRPLNVDHPPIGDGLAQDGNLLVYLANDGWRAFTGETTASIVEATSLLYRGQTRHGVSPVNLTGGRFRAAIAFGQMVVLTPEGSATTSSPTLYRHVPSRSAWYRHTYSQVWRSLYREPDGTLLAGDTAGGVWVLDTANVTPIPVTILTRADDGDSPFTQKEATDLHVVIDTGGASLTAALFVDEAATAALSHTLARTGLDVALVDLSAIGRYRRLQLQLTGSPTTCRFSGYGLTSVARPAGVLAWDSGPLDLQRREIAWIRHAWLKVNAAATLIVRFYLDGALVATRTCTIGTDLDQVYPIDLPKGCVGRQPRVTITSTAAFLPYWIELQFRDTGKGKSTPTLRIPVSVAA